MDRVRKEGCRNETVNRFQWYKQWAAMEQIKKEIVKIETLTHNNRNTPPDLTMDMMFSAGNGNDWPVALNPIDKWCKLKMWQWQWVEQMRKLLTGTG